MTDMSDNDTSRIANLDPQPVWRFFTALSAVPRPSKHEELVRQHVRRCAEQAGLSVREDQVGNLLIKVPASPGCENAPTVVLQGHLDMVPEKNADKEHDFEKDPIELLLTTEAETGEQIVTANGTTLGADNGIGLALAWAAATEPDVRHGPLELLCTVDEEAGMTGAKALSSDFFEGNILINLDSEEDDAIYIGCAGGCDNTLTWKLPLEAAGDGCQLCRVTVRGLRGGHSGGDIHENRANAIVTLARVLLAGGDGLRLREMAGGSKRNVIPREASAVVAVPADAVPALRAAIETERAAVVERSAEPQVEIALETIADGQQECLGPAETRRLLSTLAALPNGVLGVHPRMTDLVQTSNNVAVISTVADAGRLHVRVETLARSSSAAWLHAARDQIAAVAALAGAGFESGNEYPGWEPNPDSPLLAVCRRVYQQVFDREPLVTAIHAGLECGIINERAGGRLDAVSFGPNIRGAHSPDERVYVASVARIWKLLKAVLAELAG